MICLPTQNKNYDVFNKQIETLALTRTSLYALSTLDHQTIISLSQQGCQAYQTRRVLLFINFLFPTNEQVGKFKLQS